MNMERGFMLLNILLLKKSFPIILNKTAPPPSKNTDNTREERDEKSKNNRQKKTEPIILSIADNSIYRFMVMVKGVYIKDSIL